MQPPPQSPDRGGSEAKPIGANPQLGVKFLSEGIRIYPYLGTGFSMSYWYLYVVMCVRISTNPAKTPILAGQGWVMFNDPRGFLVLWGGLLAVLTNRLYGKGRLGRAVDLD